MATRPRKVLVYEAADGWRWKTKAGNGRTVRASEQAFAERRYAIADAERDNPGLVVYELTDRGLEPMPHRG